MSTTPPAESTTLSASDWDVIHEAIQQILANLVDAVGAGLPHVVCRPGRTSTQRLPLFSFVTFSRPDDSEADPVVAGVDVTVDANGFLIRSDLAGEESGNVFFSWEAMVPVNSPVERVTAAAREGANKLAGQGPALLQALSLTDWHAAVPVPAPRPGGLTDSEGVRK